MIKFNFRKLTGIMLLAVLSILFFGLLKNSQPMVASAASDFGGGTGTVNDPYQISTPEHFYNVRFHLDEYFIQVNDLDLSSITYPTGTTWFSFEGNYNGNGKKISNISFMYNNNDGVALFASLSGCVSNLTIENSEFTGNNYVGAIAGFNRGGLIKNCAVYNTVILGNANVGGIAGGNFSSGKIEECSFEGGSITARGEFYAGGIAGNNDAGILNCYAVTDIKASDINYLGGIAGFNDKNGRISHTFFKGGLFGALPGGIAGDNAGGKIDFSFFGTEGNCGIFGVNSGNIDNNTKQITGEEFAYRETFSEWADFDDLFEIKPNADYPTLKLLNDLGAIDYEYPPSEWEGEHLVTFLVIDEITGEPISNAKISLDNVPRWTDRFGEIGTDISKSFTEIRIEKSPYLCYTTVMELSDNFYSFSIKKASYDFEQGTLECSKFRLIEELTLYAENLPDSAYTSENLQAFNETFILERIRIYNAGNQNIAQKTFDNAKFSLSSIPMTEEGINNYNNSKESEFSNIFVWSNYNEDNSLIICDLLEQWRQEINGFLTPYDVNMAFDKYKTLIGMVKTDIQIAEELAAYKTEKKNELERYVNEKNKNNYSEKNWSELLRELAEGKSDIDSVQSETEVDFYFSVAINAIDNIEKLEGNKNDLALVLGLCGAGIVVFAVILIVIIKMSKKSRNSKTKLK